MGWIETYLNNPEVKRELGVPKFVEFESCNFDVNRSFMGQGDSMHNSADPAIPNLLNSGVRVLVYAGKADFMCNYIGNKQWVTDLPHELGAELSEFNDEQWYVGDQLKGSYKLAGSSENAGDGQGPQLAFLEINDAGHMVPLDQPEFALEFFNTWIHGQSFNSTN